MGASHWQSSGELWESRGERVHVFENVDALTTTDVKRQVASGSQLRSLMPVTTWEYSEEIDGRARVFGLPD